VHNDKRYSTQKVDVVLIFINNKIQRSKLTSENLILLLKFALCILVFCIKAHSKNSDNTNIDTEKPSCTTSSTISKPTNHQVFLENFTQSTKRACLSLAFDIPTILRQVTGSSYKNIAHDLFSKKIPYIGLLSVHSAETFLRSQVIYSLYLTVTPQAKVLMPDLSKEYPLIPQLCATTIIAGSDVICMNPFERIKVCLLNKRDIPFFDTKINWAQFWKSREWLFTGGTLTFQTSFVHVGTFLALKNYISPLIVKGETPSFYESLQMGAVITCAQTAITYPLLTFRARLHDQQAELFNAGKKRISSSRFFYEFYKKKQIVSFILRHIFAFNAWLCDSSSRCFSSS
jgi:hypothetical protein